MGRMLIISASSLQSSQVPNGVSALLILVMNWCNYTHLVDEVKLNGK